MAHQTRVRKSAIIWLAVTVGAGCSGGGGGTPVPVPSVVASQSPAPSAFQLSGTVSVPGILSGALGVQALKGASGVTVEILRADTGAQLATATSGSGGTFALSLPGSVAGEGVVILQATIQGLTLRGFAPTQATTGVDLTAGTTSQLRGLQTLLGGGTQFQASAALRSALVMLVGQRSSFGQLAAAIDGAADIDRSTSVQQLFGNIDYINRTHLNATLAAVQQAAGGINGLDTLGRVRLAILAYGQAATGLASALQQRQAIGGLDALSPNNRTLVTDVGNTIQAAQLQQLFAALGAASQADQAALGAVILFGTASPTPAPTATASASASPSASPTASASASASPSASPTASASASASPSASPTASASASTTPSPTSAPSPSPTPTPTPSPTPTPTPTISLANDVQPIFKVSCGLSGCHEASFANAQAAYNALVDKTSSQFPPLKLVKPGDPDHSTTYVKLLSASPSIDGVAIGAQMPYQTTPLTSSQIELIRLWILQGAQNN